MAKFVELTAETGKQFSVNIDLIQYVAPHSDSPTKSVLCFVGEIQDGIRFLTVLHSYNTLMGIINK
jgi:hypothetical protein